MWKSWRDTERSAWCNLHEDDTYMNGTEYDDFDTHCAKYLRR